MALALGAFCLIALVPMVTRAQNNVVLTLLEGGDFETPVVDSTPFYLYRPAGDERWSWLGASGVQRDGSGLGAAAPRGSQTAFLRSGNATPSQFSSQVTLNAGTYRVRFKAAQRSGIGGVPIQVKLDETAVGAPIAPTNTAFETYYSEPFQVNADGSTYRLEFGTGSMGGSAMSLIDAIALEYVAPATLNNGGFETPVYGSAPFYGFGPSGSEWNWSGTAGIQRNGSGLGVDAPAGVQTAILRGGSTPGAFSQSIWLRAGSYQIRFRAAQRATGNSVPIQVSVDGAAVGAPLTPASSSAFTSYVTPEFTVGTAGAHVVQFATNGGNGNGMSLIDDVRINATSLLVLPTPLAPFAPAGLAVTTTVTTTSAGRAAVSWQSVAGATGYRIKRATTAGGPYVTLPATVTARSFVDSPLDNATTYYYRVTAFNDAGAGADSEEVRATFLQTPVVTVAGGNNQIVLSWNPVAGATSYSAATTSTYGGADRKDLAVSGRTATDKGLGSSYAFTYRITALNANGSSTTFVRGTTLPGKPVITVVSTNRDEASVHLEWLSAGGDVPSNYKIKRATVAGGPYTTLAPNLTNTQYTDAGLARATYYYRVYAFNSSGNGPETNEVKASLIDYPAPPALSATLTGQDSTNVAVNLNWSAAPTATSYQVYRLDSNDQSRTFGDLTGLTLTDSAVVYGQTYRYHVSALNDGGYSGPSNQVTVTVVLPPAAPASLTATPGDTVVALSWSNVSGATSYRLKRGVAAGGPYTALPNVISANSFSDSGLTNGTTYYYRVTAVNAGGNSADSNEASAKPVAPPTTRPSAPANVVATPGDASVSLRWNAVSGATSYKVKRGTTSGGPYATLAPVVGNTNFSDSGLSNGTTYYYRVYAVNSAGNSPDSAQVQATPVAPVPPPGAPTNLVATAGDTQITLSWNAASDAASYKIKRSTTNNGPYTTLASSVTANAYTDTGLSNGTPYYYRVYAVNASGNGPDSDQAQATPVAPPTNSTRGVDLSIEAMNNSTQGEVGVNDYYPDVTQEATYSISDRSAAIFRLRVYNRGTASDNIRLGGRGDTPGWKVRYFSAFVGGTDVSAQVKANNHVLTLPVGGQSAFRVEVTPDSSAPQNVGKSVPIAAYSDSDSAARDQVTAIAVPSGPPLPSYRPDSLVRVAGQADYRGEGIYDFMASDEQTVISTASSGVAAVYNLKIINKGNVADSFKFKLPLAKQGWSLSLYDALNGGTDLTGTAQQGTGFTTQSLAPQQFKEFRLEVKPNSGTTGSFPVSIVTTSFTDSAVQDVGLFDTTVGNVSTSAAVTFIGSPRACAGGIDNALHKLTLTLRATNNGAPLPNAPIALSFENNVGHNYGTKATPDVRHKAKIYDPNEPIIANRWKETVTLTTDKDGNAQVTVLSSDVISQPQIIARWQNAIVGRLPCDFAAATSKRGVPDPVVGNYNGWQNDDFGWTCDFGAIENSGDTAIAKLYLKYLDSSGNYAPVAGHKVLIKVARLNTSGGSPIFDSDEAATYVTFLNGMDESTSAVVTTDQDGVAQVTLKTKADISAMSSLEFSARNLTQWAK